ncbi:cytochrome c oxidase subunit 2A [Bacillus methanolicus]|nr:cytochrome c oxidase subunit 2A [Bacillus methanolicus]MDE3839331.1 cytochrome c oxidase subunit 2A [Bacillus methanolicus]
MAEPQLAKKTEAKNEESTSLKGTLASVFLLGFFIVFTWLGVYYLYLDRF